jgi:GTP-binding protein Era
MTRSGHIALAGAPNVGKSSLLNALVGSHLAIVSPKAQSTRLPVTGLRTEAETQFVFHDLPGLLDPRYPLQERMRAAALEVLERVHVILHLHPADQGEAPAFWPLTGLQRSQAVPVLTVRTKCDLMAGSAVSGLPVSATTGAGLDQLLDQIRPFLPEGPFEFDPEDIGTQPLRFFATEYLREAAFDLLGTTALRVAVRWRSSASTRRRYTFVSPCGGTGVAEGHRDWTRRPDAQGHRGPRPAEA